MKKIDNWLSIQRYVTEVAAAQPLVFKSDIELVGKVVPAKRPPVRGRRRFFAPKLTRI